MRAHRLLGREIDLRSLEWWCAFVAGSRWVKRVIGVSIFHQSSSLDACDDLIAYRMQPAGQNDSFS